MVTESVSEMLARRVRAEIEKIRSFLNKPRSYRAMHMAVIRKAIPGGTAGRNRKIQAKDYPKLAALSEQLHPAVYRFLSVKKHAPNQSVIQTIEFLRPEFPAEIAQYLLDHAAYLDEQYRKMPKHKTPKFQARWLADVLAGSNSPWRLKPSYAVRICKEVRGSIRRKSRPV